MPDTLTNPIAIEQLIGLWWVKFKRARDGGEKLAAAKALARHATRYDVIVSQGEKEHG